MSQIHRTHRIKGYRVATSIALALVCTLVVVITSSMSVTAATLRVPADYPVIKAAIFAATSGDTVLVAPGTYTGDGNRGLDFGGMAIVLRSEAGAAATVLDCQATSEFHHRVITLTSGEDSSSVIEGFTMTGAYAGGEAIYLENAGVKLIRCSIINNGGYGIRQLPIIPPFHWLVIDSCTITGNGADGVYATRNFVVRNSTISHNTGNGLYAKEPNSSSNVTYSLFANNGLAGMGGVSFAGNMAYVKNCTFVGNNDGLACIVDLPYGRAAAAGPKVENCLFAYNRNYGYNCGGYVQPVATCCDAFGNKTNWNRANYPPAIADTLGNFSGNPLFCDSTAVNFHLMNSSPCLAANNSCATLIGALGEGCLCCQGVTADVNLSGGVNLADLSALVSYLTCGGYTLLCETEANVNGSGSVDLADLSALSNFLTVGTYALPSCP